MGLLKGRQFGAMETFCSKGGIKMRARMQMEH